MTPVRYVVHAVCVTMISDERLGQNWLGVLAGHVTRPGKMATGLLQLPGGKQDPGESDPVATLLRECREELWDDPADVPPKLGFELLEARPMVDYVVANTGRELLLKLGLFGRLTGVPVLPPRSQEFDRLKYWPLIDLIREQGARSDPTTPEMFFGMGEIIAVSLKKNSFGAYRNGSLQPCELDLPWLRREARLRLIARGGFSKADAPSAIPF